MLLIALAEMFWSFCLVFIYCDLGERISDGFNELYDVICMLKWHKYPIEIQRMLIDILIVTQQPVVIQGFGNVYCTRNACQKVCIFFFNPRLNCEQFYLTISLFRSLIVVSHIL